ALPIFRPALADRYPDRRQRCGRESDARAIAVATSAQRAGSRRHAHPAARRCALDQYRRGPNQGDSGGVSAARYRPEPADCALGKLADVAEFLAESKERRQLSGGHRIAAIPNRFAASAAEHSTCEW